MPPKGAATHARLIDEAMTQVTVRGLAAVSLQDVAGAAGVSKSAVLKHFQSKEALQIELDDQPGPLRDTLKASQQRWAKVLKREFRALNPNADDATLEVLVFQFKGIVLAYGHSRRLLDDDTARTQATAAYRMLVASASQS